MLYDCDICHKSFQTAYELKRHYESKHECEHTCPWYAHKCMDCPYYGELKIRLGIK